MLESSTELNCILFEIEIEFKYRREKKQLQWVENEIDI